MSALTAARSTTFRGGYKNIRTITLGGTVYQGGLVARNGSGVGVAASDASGLKVIGVALEGGVSGDKIRVATGICNLGNGGSYTAANIGDKVYVSDDQTVTTAASATNDIPVGVIWDFDANSILWVDTSLAPVC